MKHINLKFYIFTILISLIMLSHSVSCKSTSSSKNNNYSNSLTWGGLKRTYLIHLPQHYNKNSQKSLVIVLHGGGGNGRGMIRLTNFNNVADKEGFIVVYPDGIDKHWNDGREGSETSHKAHIDQIDDVGFISVLIDKLTVELNIDKRRVYVCGISNGAMMTYRLGCELTQKIAAIAAIAGNMPKSLVCSKNLQQIPVLIISGTDDPLMPFNGGNITGPFGNKKLGQVLSLKETVVFWTKFNNCSLSPMFSYEPDKDPDDGTRVRKEIYRGDTNSSEVVVYIIEKGGHTWPGGYQYLPEKLIGKTSKDINATELIWDFFKTHLKQ